MKLLITALPLIFFIILAYNMIELAVDNVLLIWILFILAGLCASAATHILLKKG